MDATSVNFGCLRFTSHTHARSRALRMFALISLVTCGALASAMAQSGVLSYRMEFSRTGRSVNYPKPQDGYLIVDLASGSVSSVIVLDDPQGGGKYYTSGLLSGYYFTATSESNGRVSDVISAGAAGSLDSAMLQVSGKTSSSVDIGGEESVAAAKQMTGFLLMNGADAVVVDSEDAEPDDNSEIAIGYVGTARVTVRLAENDTQNFNNNAKTASDAVSAYSDWFSNQGIQSEEGNLPSPTPTPELVTPIFEQDPLGLN